MRVYVESNFVLEIVLEQSGERSCLELLDLAEARSIDLRIPSFALLETEETLARRAREWRMLVERIDAQTREFSRTRSLQTGAAAVAQLTVQATQLTAKHQRRVRSRILDVATILPVGHPTLRSANRLQRRHGLSLADAIMLASVLIDRPKDSGEAFFINVNKKDFGDAPVRQKLASRRCTLITRFDAGAAAVAARLGREAPA